MRLRPERLLVGVGAALLIASGGAGGASGIPQARPGGSAITGGLAADCRAEGDRATFYGGGAHGYTDYPPLRVAS